MMRNVVIKKKLLILKKFVMHSRVISNLNYHHLKNLSFQIGLNMVILQIKLLMP